MHKTNLPITEKQQAKLQVCEINWVRRIAGAKNRGTEEGSWCERESHEEAGVRESLTRKLV